MTRDERDHLRALIDQARRDRIARSSAATTPRRRTYWADIERFVNQMRADRRKQAA